MTQDINIGMSSEQREAIAEGLKYLLADTYTLYLKTHNFHWNVTGPQFNSLHLMFEKQYNEIWTAVDEIAERIRALGFFVPASYQAFAKLTSIKEADDALLAAPEMIKQLVIGHESVIRTARSIFPAVDKAFDQPTNDLLTRRMEEHEKTAWMLRSLLEK